MPCTLRPSPGRSYQESWSEYLSALMQGLQQRLLLTLMFTKSQTHALVPQEYNSALLLDLGQD